MIDVVVIGGGIIGGASALALAERGLRVALVERGPAAVERGPASGAATPCAAGILGAQLEAPGDGPFVRLCLASRDRYAAWVRALEAQSGIDIGYRASGVMIAAYDAPALEALTARVEWQARAGLAVDRLDAATARDLEPALAASIAGAVRFRDDARLDPPALLAAVRRAAERAGVAFHSGTAVQRILARGGHAAGVLLADGRTLEAAAVVLAAGSWSPLIDGARLPDGAVRPARGQILELTLPAPVLRGVIEGPRCYLSPRDDGRVLVGSTVELAGFAPQVTAGAARDLLTAAIELVPALAEATLTRAWAGLRPYTSDELPILGPGALDGLILATGHYRNGVLLGPITAAIVAALVLGEPPPVDLAPFSAARLDRRS